MSNPIIERTIEENNLSIFTDHYLVNQEGGFPILKGGPRYDFYMANWTAMGKPKKDPLVVQSSGVTFEVEVRKDPKLGLYFFEKRGFVFLPWFTDFLRAPQKSKTVIGLAGVGKAQPLTSRVLTPTGWATMGQLEMGDRVIGHDGEAHQIVGIYPQGIRPIYEVEFDDGAVVEADAEHLWVSRHDASNPWQIRTTLELKEYADRKAKQYVPVTSPVEFDDRDVPIDPYLMGVLLGDGSFRENSLMLTTADEQMVEMVNEISPFGLSMQYKEKYDYAITGEYEGRCNPAISEIKKLGLWKLNSHEKFIPECYKINSKNKRIALLQGLLDTDGCVSRGYGVEYSTVSQHLAKDVEELVLSLGAKCTVSFRSTKCNDKEFWSYRIYIRLPVEIQPFRLERKLNAYAPREKYAELSKRVISVRYVRDDYAQCIMVDSGDHTYITDGYTVTHNTAQVGVAGMVKCAMYPGYKFMNVAPTLKISGLMTEAIIGKIQGTKFWDEFLIDGKAAFVQKPFAEFRFRNGSFARFMNIEKNADNIQSEWFDWGNIDEAGILRRITDTGVDELGTMMMGIRTRMRGTRDNGIPREGTLSMISMAYDCDTLWERYEYGFQPETKDQFYSRLVTHKENPYLTYEQLQQFELEARRYHNYDQWMLGIRPPKIGGEFNQKLVSEALIEPDPEATIEEGDAGICIYEEPYKEGHFYVAAGDPGTGDAPGRNAPTITVWDITEFPLGAARLAAFYWGFGGGSYQPFVFNFERLCHQYRVPINYRGYDSTSNQKALAELVFEAGGLEVVPLGFDSGKKFMYINAMKVLLSNNKIVFPKNIVGIRKQLLDYVTPDKGIAQDIVSSMSMASWLIFPLFQDVYEPTPQTKDYDGPTYAPVGRYARSNPNRYQAHLR